MAIIYNGQTISYGNGSTSLTVNASTSGIVGTVYALTAATAYYINVTIDAGYTLTISRTTDFRVSGTLTINGTIQNYNYPSGGNNAPGITGGSGTGGGGGGGVGSAGNSGGGGARNGGSAPGGAIYAGNGTGGITYYSDVIPATYNGGQGQWGSGGDGGTPDNAGGGIYGSGASSFKIIAKNIVHGSAAKIYAYGGAGTNGSTNYGSGQGGGGGGGGGGGTVIIFAETESGTISYDVAGGGGGGGGGGGLNASNNNYGGSGGTGGSGKIYALIGSSTATRTVYPSVSYYATLSGTYDTTAPVFSNLSKSVTTAGPNQNQVVTVTITDSQTTVQTPTAVLSGSGIGGTVTLTSFTSNVATFTISGHTGTGTATLTINATDSAGNTSTTTTSWAVDSSYPAGFVPFFGSSTTDWILDGTAAPSGLTLSGTTYTITAATDPTQSYSFDLKNLTIASTYYLKWRGSLTLKINGTATINGILGYGNYRSSTAPTGAIYGTISSGAGGNGGDGGGNNSTGGSGYGFTSAGVWTTVTSGGGGGGPNGGGGGGHAYRIPSATATRTAAISNGVSVGAGGGGGGGWNRGGGQASAGGGGLILYAQTLTGTGTVEVCGDAGKAGDRYDSSSSNPGPRESGGGGGGGGGGHIIAIIGTNNSSTLRFAAHGGAGGDYAWNNGYPTSNGLGGSGSSGYIQYYYSSGSTPLFALGPTSNAITTSATTFTLDTTIPATVSANQASAGANISYQYAKSGTVQRISITYSKTMIDSTVKITLSGAATLTATTMTKNTSLTNTYYYDYTCSSGDGTITYKINGSDGVNNPATEISGTWILDNTAPVISTSISPNKTYFSPGEIITVTATITEANLLNGNPTMTFAKGSNYFGQDPPSALLSYSSLSGSTYTYTASFVVPVASGALSSTITTTDFAGNNTSYSGLISANTGLVISQASSIIWF